MKAKSFSACVFVQWNKKDKLSASDFDLIQKLAKNVDKLLVIRNLNKLQKSRNPDKEVPANVEIIARQNFGYDFGAYKFGIEYLLATENKLGDLVLCNNSIVCAEPSLEKLFENLRSSELDVCGLTDSYEREWHLQSYFLNFKENVSSSKVFADWWESASISDLKGETITNLEIPLAKYFQSQGFKVGAIWPQRKIIDFALSIFGIEIWTDAKYSKSVRETYRKISCGEPINSTHALWKHLRYLDFPFLKRDLISGRVAGVFTPDDWPNFVCHQNSNIQLTSEFK